jgi:stage II sporulation protein P
MLSALIISMSAFSVNVEEFARKATSFTLSFFMGISAAEEEIKEIYIDLDEDISSQMQLEIEKLNSSLLKGEVLEIKNKHSVLIYHTHNDEAFYKGDKDYKETSTGRTKDTEYSIVKVGAEFSKRLTEYGFQVTHEKNDNVRNGFYKAYDTAYEMLKGYKDTIDIFVDMHRDAYSGKEPNYITHGETEYAYISLVVAKGENYDPKPNWQENYKIAKLLMDEINSICPGLVKKIIFKDRRFNQHISKSCILLEMGNEKNTLEQVLASANVVAQGFNQVFK